MFVYNTHTFCVLKDKTISSEAMETIERTGTQQLKMIGCAAGL
jgi:hypothetical protein